MAEELIAYGSRIEIAYAKEDSWAILPSAPTAYKLRCTGFGVQLGKDSFTSNELRSDRQVSDLRHGMFNVNGDVPVELSYGAFDDLIESAMFNTWDASNTIKIGTTQKSLTIQRGFTDLNEYHVFWGCVVNRWTVTINPNSIVTSTFTFIGKEMTLTQTLTNPIDKATNAPFDSFSGVLKEGGNTIAIVTGLDFTLENNITPLQVVGANKAVGLAEGRANVTGTLTAYFNGSSLLEKFLDETESSIEVSITDDSGNSLTFYFPRIKYSGGDVRIDGDGPITISLPFTALYDSTYSTLYISR